MVGSLEEIVFKMTVKNSEAIKKIVKVKDTFLQMTKAVTPQFVELTQKILRQEKAINKLRDAARRLRAENISRTRQGVFRRKILTGKAQGLVDNATRINALGNQFDSFGKSMGMPLETWKKFNQEGGRFKTVGGRVGNTVRKLTHGLRGFRMEMLGVMFFGMGMSRLFKGLLMPALQLVGIFDLFRVVLQVLFLPIALTILDLFLPWIDYIINLSDATKKTIGWIVIFGAAIGGLLFLVGSIALGLGSIILVFGGVLAAVISVVTSFFSLGGAMSAFLLIGTGMGALSSITDGFKTVTESLLQKLLKFQFVKDLFERFGVTINHNQTAFENFKALAIEVANSILKQFGYDEGVGSLFVKLQAAGATVWDSLKTATKEMITALGDLYNVLFKIHEFYKMLSAIWGIGKGGIADTIARGKELAGTKEIFNVGDAGITPGKTPGGMIRPAGYTPINVEVTVNGNANEMAEAVGKLVEETLFEKLFNFGRGDSV